MLVHWCMCTVVYPFFGTVADAVVRLLRLQGSAGAAQVQRRLRERLGERETVARAARRIWRRGLARCRAPLEAVLGHSRASAAQDAGGMGRTPEDTVPQAPLRAGGG